MGRIWTIVLYNCTIKNLTDAQYRNSRINAEKVKLVNSDSTYLQSIPYVSHYRYSWRCTLQ